MEKMISATEITPIIYEAISESRADVWLNKNIEQFTEEFPEGGSQEMWRADSVHFLTSLTFEEIEEEFEKLWAEHTEPQPTMADIIEGMNALMDLIGG